MQKVNDEDLIKVVQVYNEEGRTAAYDFLKSAYGVKNPYFIRKRMINDPRFEYSEDTDSFRINGHTDSESLFMSMDELCSPVIVRAVQSKDKQLIDNRPAEMEKLIQELLGDRLLELSRYITLDSSRKTMLIDQTSLKNAGYRVITH